MKIYFAFETVNGVPVRAVSHGYTTYKEAKNHYPDEVVIGVECPRRHRNSYRWGKTELLGNMALNEERELPITSEGDYSGWRAIASSIKAMGGNTYKIRKENNQIIIKRTR